MNKEQNLMELIENLDELKTNAKTLHSYSKSDDTAKKEFASSLIARGKCFVVFETENCIEFYPSRFLGYKSNTVSLHNSARQNHKIHGGETTRRINELLGVSPEQDDDLEAKYETFCEKYHITPLNQERKFWLKKITLKQEN